jgi:hypothetical protein
VIPSRLACRPVSWRVVECETAIAGMARSYRWVCNGRVVIARRGALLQVGLQWSGGYRVLGRAPTGGDADPFHDQVMRLD